jgi:excisionase family DNA binding protein
VTLRSVAGVETLLDKPAAAAKLGTTVRHLTDLVARREIPFVKVGRLVRFKPDDIDAYIERQTSEAVS